MVKADEFTQSSLTDKNFSVVNLHMPGGFGGASVVPSGHKAGVGGLRAGHVVEQAQDCSPEGCDFTQDAEVSRMT